jgi:hypothetical protein
MSLYKSCGILPFGWSKTPANDADIQAHCTVDGSTFCNIDTTVFKDGKCVAKIPGCTDPEDPNYNGAANFEDGSCSLRCNIATHKSKNGVCVPKDEL